MSSYVVLVPARFQQSRYHGLDCCKATDTHRAAAEHSRSEVVGSMMES
jgi:hypothetical protein